MQISGLSTNLAPNTTYGFYLWGVGDNTGQGSGFIFGGTASEASDTEDPDTASAANFVAKFTFTTGATVSDTLDFGWYTLGGNHGGLNGFAIVEDRAATVFPPAGLEATGGDMQIDLTWEDAPSAETYTIYRSTNGVDFAQLDSGVTDTNYTDSPVMVNVPYHYNVASVSNGAESVPSLTVSAIAYDGSDMTPPAPPADFAAVQANAYGVYMTWTNNTEADLVEYLVYRAMTADGIYSNIAATTATTFTDTHGAQRAGVFDYKVQAIDLAGNESAASTEVTVDMTERYILELDVFTTNVNPSANNVGPDWLDAAEGRTENTGDIGGGRNLGWTGAGEWTTHLVKLPAPGYYSFIPRCAVNNGGAEASMDVYLLPDTNTVMGTIEMPHTGGWQSWTTAPPSEVYFPVSGVQTVRFVQVTGGFNLNWIEVVQQGPQFASVDVAGSDVILGWTAGDYKLYDVEETADLAVDPVSWDPISGLTNIPGVAGTMVATTSVSGAFAAYRVLESDAPATTAYETGFESGMNGWTTGVVGAVGTAWELGTPTTGPGAANSGVNAWATNLDGNHGYDADVWLRSPQIDLTGATSATLRFFEFVDIETDAAATDSAIVRVLNASLVQLAEVYHENGTSTAWEEVAVSLPPAAVNQPVILEFNFISDNFANQQGWYIDDVSVTIP